MRIMVQMKSVLIHADLWSVVCGRVVKRENGNAQAKADFDTKDEKATQINNVKHCRTSANVWSLLREIHVPRGPARRVTLLKQLLATKKKE